MVLAIAIIVGVILTGVFAARKGGTAEDAELELRRSDEAHEPNRDHTWEP